MDFLIKDAILINVTDKAILDPLQGVAKRGRPRKVPGAEPSADQMRRLQFIERAAFWTGQVGRHDVATTFDVSVSHVTSDFHRYREMAPRNLAYDVSEKCFRPTDAFKPLFAIDGSATILSTIAASVVLPTQDCGRLLGFMPTADVAQPLPAEIDLALLVTLCRAITSCMMLNINYQSMATPEAVERQFWPQALIFTGQRWLVRGWDWRHGAYRDLALVRIVRAEPGPVVQDDLPRDDQWHNRATLQIGLVDGLSDGQAEVTAREFGMRRQPDDSFTISIEPRQAMVPYVLDHLRLRQPDTAAQATLIRLHNYDEIRKFDRVNVAR